MKKTIVAAALMALAGLSIAKLPAPVLDDAAKAKAAEAAAKTAWQGKYDAYQLCKAQDRAAANYLKTAGKAAAKPAPAKAAAPAASGAPAAAAAPPPCTDPGAFVYTPAAPAAPAAGAAPAAAASAKKS